MEHVGARLRAARMRFGFTLREVQERSARLSLHWGQSSYRISASWLDRVEREGRSLSLSKFIVLAAIYNITPDEVLAYFPDLTNDIQAPDHPATPNTTLLLTKGPLEDHARLWLPDRIAIDPIPNHTTLLRSDIHFPTTLRRGIIGKLDKTLDPLIRPGSIVLINTLRRAIAHRREWTNEFDRPIYFLFTRCGYFCGWCELDKDAECLSLIPHPLSHTPAQRWCCRKEVEVIGRISAVLLRLDEPRSL